MDRYWKTIGKIWGKYGKNWLITGHLSYRRAIGSIGNEFAASIWGSLSPPRPSRASKMSKMCQKNWVTQFLRYQFLSIQDSIKIWGGGLVFNLQPSMALGACSAERWFINPPSLQARACRGTQNGFLCICFFFVILQFSNFAILQFCIFCISFVFFL